MPTRSKGRGTVVHVAKRRRFVAALVVDGRKYQKVATYAGTREMGTAKRRAEALLDELRRRHLEGGDLGAGEWTLGSYLEQRWLPHIEPNLRNMTFVGYSGMVHNHIIRLLGKRKLVELTNVDVDAFLATLYREGRSPTLRQRARKILGRALEQAVAWNLIERNAVRATKPPPVPNIERETLSTEEARKFLAAIAGERLEAAFLLGAVLGLRSGEVRGLRWSDLKDNMLRVERGLTYERLPDGSHVYALSETKTPRSRRTLFLPAFVVAALERRRQAQLDESRYPGWANPQDLIFTGQYSGDPISAFGMMQRLKLVLEREGLPVIPFHSLRHAAASLLFAQGLSPRTVQDILGHATPTMTLAVYAHTDDEQRRAAARALDAWEASG